MTSEPAAARGPGSPWIGSVDLPGRTTEVRVGGGLRTTLRAEIRARFPRAHRFWMVVDRRVAKLWPLEEAFPGDAPEASIVRLPPGEPVKTRYRLRQLQDLFMVLTRDEPVVAVGGGATTDVVGFAAATVKRGLPWIVVPTTVVGMADAAIGGKVGINHRRGKNLLGTFHPPRLVLADVDYLSTLPARDTLAGLAEVYKAGRVGDPVLLAKVRRGVPTDAAVWTEVIGRAIDVKARLVEADERDEGPRRALNFGHTVGHALETLLGSDVIRHGEAVAIGMAVAARIAARRGLFPPAEEQKQHDDFLWLRFPTALPDGASADEILEAIRVDKKKRPGDLHSFVLPTGSTGVTVVEDVSDDEVRAALAGPLSASARS